MGIALLANSMRQTLKLQDSAFLKTASGSAAEVVWVLPVTANLLMHIDFSDTATVFQEAARSTPSLPGDPIGGVADKSGNDNHLYQNTASLKPLVAVGPGRRVSDSSRTGGPSYVYPYLVFTSALTTIRTVVMVGKGKEATQQPGYEIWNFGHSSTYHWSALDNNKMFDASWSSTSIGTVTIDGSAYTRATAPSLSNNKYKTYSIETTGNLQAEYHSHDRTEGGRCYNGYCGEFVIYSTALNASDLALVTAYFKGKWGT